MAGERLTLSQSQFDRIVEAVKRIEAFIRGEGVPARGQSRGGGPPSYIAKTRSGGIAARVGDTLGHATVDVYHLENWVRTSSGFELEVGNMATGSGGAVGANEFIQVKWLGGAYVVDWEDCPPP